MKYTMKIFGGAVAVLLLVSLALVGASVADDSVSAPKLAIASLQHDDCAVTIVGDSSVSEDGKHGFTAVCKDGHVHTYTWSISDPTIATIDGNGVLSPLKTGTVTITVTDDGGCSVSKTITIVKKDSADSALHDGCVVSIVGDSSVSEDGKHGFTAVCKDGHVHTYTWNVSDPTIATIDGNGVLSPIKVGSITITVTDDGGCSVSKTIAVVKKEGSSAQTPFPVLGILAGLGAAAVFLRRH